MTTPPVYIYTTNKMYICYHFIDVFTIKAIKDKYILYIDAISILRRSYVVIFIFAMKVDII
ncbi:hypothetical protein B7R76_02495 [Mageeibacillus indolicus]|uniref:Uncharacterized protein n=1 Tax=Mageeibacillus indolicus TaxID=884684 RepID=A0A2J8B4R4_9FIRM|nr:hypothetical protein B7R76_02495 [Mageeibacillus indolicus]